jgi:hypothetical protein
MVIYPELSYTRVPGCYNDLIGDGGAKFRPYHRIESCKTNMKIAYIFLDDYMGKDVGINALCVYV